MSWTESTRARASLDPFEDTSLLVANGETAQLLTSTSQFVSILENFGVQGPQHLWHANIDMRGQFVASGSQFDVFANQDLSNVVMKRVRVPLFDTENTSETDIDERLRRSLRLLELEIRALCHPDVRRHANIVDLLSWAYDYPSWDAKHRIPVLFMEKAAFSLHDLLQGHTQETKVSTAMKHQLCLDVVDGLNCIHTCKIIHGDLKPRNILIFRHEHPKIPLQAKLSDFGVCIALADSQKLSFKSYLGTKGWLAPECFAYEEIKHGPFYPELLFKCDVYSFGLLTLSTFVKKGLPILSDNDSTSNENRIYQAILTLREHPDIPAKLQIRLKTLCYTALREKPSERGELDFSILADDSKGYQDWYIRKEKHAGQLSLSSTFSNFSTGDSYWHGIDTSLLQELEEQYDRGVASAHATVLPPETLFGMAKKYSDSRVVDANVKTRKFVTAAARASSLPAMGVMSRILDHCVTDMVYDADDQHFRDKSLHEAVANGSWIAAEDLRRLDNASFVSAKKFFWFRGGYNSEADELKSISVRDKTTRQLQDTYFSSDPNTIMDLHGNKILHIMAMFDKSEAVRLLLGTSRSSLDSQNENGETAMYKACLAGNIETVETLAMYLADASIPSGAFGVTCLHWLFNFSPDKTNRAVQALIKSGAQMNARTSRKIENTIRLHITWNHFPFYFPIGTALHWAVAARSFSAIEALLMHGADINEPDCHIDGEAQSALSQAVYRGDSEMVIYLIAKGASAQILDCKGRNLFHILSLHSRGCNRLPVFPRKMFWWVYHGRSERHSNELLQIVLALKETRIGIDAFDSQKPPFTPLLYAIEAADAGTVLALLKGGADANICSKSQGTTPLLTWASTNKHRLAYPSLYRTVFEALAERTQDLHVRSKLSGDSVFHHALRNSDLEDIEYMFSYLGHNTDQSVDTDAANDKGLTPLLDALDSSGLDVGFMVKQVLRFNPDLSHRAVDGRDYVWIACSNFRITDVQCLDLLKVRFANLGGKEISSIIRNSVTKYNMPALHRAAANGHRQSMLYLLNHGADITYVNNRGEAVLDVALEAAESMRRKVLRRWRNHPGARANLKDRSSLPFFLFDTVGPDSFGELLFLFDPSPLAFPSHQAARGRKWF